MKYYLMINYNNSYSTAVCKRGIKKINKGMNKYQNAYNETV